MPLISQPAGIAHYIFAAKPLPSFLIVFTLNPEV